MKTSHQLARELLNGPDVPAYIYTEPKGDDDPIGHDVKAVLMQGASRDGEDVEVVELYGDRSVVAEADDAPLQPIPSGPPTLKDVQELKKCSVGRELHGLNFPESAVSFFVGNSECVLTVEELNRLAAWASEYG